MKTILITQCLQHDFIRPVGRYDPLPNLLHIGFEESRRLIGEKPDEGPVARLLAWAHDQPETDLGIVHIRDWHDQNNAFQAAHYAQFGPHCEAGTAGAEFVFDVPESRDVHIVSTTTLNDFIDTDLESLLREFGDGPVRVGITGVWTEAKITFLSYDLRSRFPNFELAVCDALTASSSRANHFAALGQLEKILGVQIISSLGEFISWLGGEGESLPLIGYSERHPQVTLQGEIQLADEDRQLLRYLYRGCQHIEARPLDGGFSGNAVLGVKSVDLNGHEQAGHVVKIGPREEIGEERASFERIEAVMGNNAPQISDFADLGNRGAIKYRYASMGSGNSRSLQQCYEEGVDTETFCDWLDVVFEEQLGRLYAAAQRESVDLIDYYEFSPRWAQSVRDKVEDLIGYAATGDSIALPAGLECPNLCQFYEQELAQLPRIPRSHYHAWLHGDLNGANIIVDARENIWLIDFFHTHRGHVLKDLIKFENDLLYIFTKIESEQELAEAVCITEALLAVEDLGSPLGDLPAGISSAKFKRCWSVLQRLRSYYPALIEADRDPLQLFIGQLRYAAHTLGFEECSRWQKLWALYAAGGLAREVIRRHRGSGPLRVDWINDPSIGNERLGLTLLPGRKDYRRDLNADIASLQAAGVDAVVCLLMPHELNEYGVDDLLQSYQNAGIELKTCPIRDYGVPTANAMTDLLDWIEQQLSAEKRIMVHCVGGLGRSGLVAAALLIRRGLDMADAMRVVRRDRSSRAIESAEQELFLERWGSRTPTTEAVKAGD